MLSALNQEKMLHLEIELGGHQHFQRTWLMVLAQTQHVAQTD